MDEFQVYLQHVCFQTKQTSLNHLYTQRKDQDTAFPKLLRVMAVYNGRVGYAPTVYEALKQVGIETDPNKTKTAETISAEAVTKGTGGTATPEKKPAAEPESGTRPESGATPATGGSGPAPGASPKDVEAAVGDLDAALGRVREAQKSGDLGEFGTALEELQKAVDAYRKVSGG